MMAVRMGRETYSMFFDFSNYTIWMMNLQDEYCISLKLIATLSSSITTSTSDSNTTIATATATAIATREIGALYAMNEVDIFPDDPKSAEFIKQLEQVNQTVTRCLTPSYSYFGVLGRDVPQTSR
ncbi:uncharacterized protein [Euphorbia lathyris]|uniref:uncharacterized protein n=1 Tax=Euphorbia lathyris TaxID=212925 RepID=UPI003314273F